MIFKFGIKRLLKAIQSKYLQYRRKKYISVIRDFMIDGNNNNISIICTNCFGGRVMQDIGMEYNTPTLGLFFDYPDYIEFLSNLPYYLNEAELTFINKSRYPERNASRSKWPEKYPIGLLAGKVEVNFLHYHSEKEAADKWIRRTQRINWDKLFVIGMDQNRCRLEDIEAFNRLPYNKIFFSSKPVEGDSIVFVKEFADENSVGDPYKYGHIFYKYLVKYLMHK